MFINFWYAMARSDEVGDTPFKTRVLGHNFVLFRDTAGTVRCLNNVCTHRGGSLAAGRVRGDCIACPYHGWEFDGTGQCHKIPSAGRAAKPGARTRNDAYPTQEKAGLIFAFLGDLPEDERPPLIDIPELDDPEWRLTVLDWEINANYERAVENALDPAHNEFVHPVSGSAGERDDYFVKPLEPMPADWGIGFMTTFETQAPKKAGIDDSIKGKAAPAMTVEAGSGFHGPNALWTYLHFGAWNKMHQYLFETPIDETRIRAFNLNYRNSMLEEHFDEIIDRQNKTIAAQDVTILEDLEPIRTPDTLTRENMVEADSIVVRYREHLKDWEDRGWRIDSDRVAADRINTAFAIPSPQRRLSRNWALPAVPMRPGATGSE